MAAQKCADCSGVEFDEIDGVLVCMQCGTELEGSVNLVEDSGSAWVGKSSTNTNNSHTAYRHRDQSDIKKRLVANAVAMLCSALRAPQAVQERIRYMVGQVQPELGAGRRMKALCAACTYIVMRREPYRYVVMLLQVADAANLGDRGVVEVARAYKHAMAKLEIKWGDIHQEGDLEALVDRCLDALTESGHLGQHEDYVQETSKRLVQLARDNQLFTSQKESGMVGACVFLAGRGCGCNLTLKQVAAPILVSDFTVKKQVTVVKKLLMQLAKRFICYLSGSMESLKDLDRYLQDVLKNSSLRILQKASMAPTAAQPQKMAAPGADFLPGGVRLFPSARNLPAWNPLGAAPGFQRAQADTARRAAKIRRAVERIQLIKTTQNGEGKSEAPLNDTLLRARSQEGSSPPPEVPGVEPGIDEEDLLISEALLRGASEEELLGGHYEAALAAHASMEGGRDLSSTELCEADLPEHQMAHYIKPAAVIAAGGCWKALPHRTGMVEDTLQAAAGEGGPAATATHGRKAGLEELAPPAKRHKQQVVEGKGSDSEHKAIQPSAEESANGLNSEDDDEGAGTLLGAAAEQRRLRRNLSSGSERSGYSDPG